ncbi:MAG: quinolinate synthase NadA [Clostridia bacterium]|nr:quinolinate synthase NadA [Clostridia bacterium]
MNTIKDIQQEILKLKKENDICILAHSYEAHEILEIADFTGDSYALSVKAKSVDNKTVLMCGVRFMAETVKILSPEKKVILATPEAGCEMADMMDKAMIEKVKTQYPDYTVVAYVNTTAELKTICDVCVTSSSAVNVVKNIKNDKILFIPDTNLGTFVKESLPEKEIMLLDGCCPIHAAVTPDEVEMARTAHPDALLLVHPECRPDVSAMADFAGSTADIMAYAKKSDKTEFIIGTEISIAEHLQYECPDKRFYPLSGKLICKNMRLTTLVDVLDCCRGAGGEEIVLSNDTISKAKRCIDEMIRLNHE